MQSNQNKELGDISILCRALVEQMDGIVFVFDLDFKQLIYVSPQINKILGYSPEKLINNPHFLTEIIHSEDLLILKNKTRELVQTKKESRLDLKVKRADQQEIDISVYFKLIRNEDGGPFVWQISMFDISQQKSYERAARENQIRTQAILGVIPDTIFVIDQTGLIRESYISDTILKEKTPDDYLGKSFLELTPPEQQDTVKKIISEIISEQKQKLFKYPVKHGNKLSFYETRGMPLSETEILFIIRDITQQVEAEKALKESEARYRDLINGIPDVVFLTDLEGVITFVNEKAREVFNAPVSGNLLGTNLYDLVPEDQRQELKKQIKKLNLFGGDVALILDIFKENYTFPGEISISLTNDNDDIHSGYIFVIRDIAERVRAEEELTLANEKLKETVARLEEINRETLIHNEMNDLMQSSLKIEEAYTVIAQYAEELYGDQSGALMRLNDTHTLLEIVATWGGENQPGELVFPSEQCWALRRGRLHVVPDEKYRLRCEHHSLPMYKAYLCVPLLAQGKTFGVLYQQVKDQENLDRYEQMTKTFSERIALALANLELGESLRMQSIRDPLTGLFNRRYMEETLERELRRSIRYKRPLGLLMLDLDHFKEVNDTYGHSAGDLLLEKLGGYLQSHIRKEDVACRYGGDEFIIILPESSLEESQKRAEHLRLGINQIIVEYRNQPLRSVAVSIGVTGYPDHADTSEAIMQIVDDALFKGKKGGRNRVFVANPGQI